MPWIGTEWNSFAGTRSNQNWYYRRYRGPVSHFDLWQRCHCHGGQIYVHGDTCMRWTHLGFSVDLDGWISWISILTDSTFMFWTLICLQYQDKIMFYDEGQSWSQQNVLIVYQMKFQLFTMTGFWSLCRISLLPRHIVMHSQGNWLQG